MAAAISLLGPVTPPAALHSDQIVRAETVPYGAARLEDTALNAFRASMLEQMREDGVPLPSAYNPFPDAPKSEPDKNQVQYDSWSGAVTGELPNAPSMNEPFGELNLAFRGELPDFYMGNRHPSHRIAGKTRTAEPPVCERLAIMDSVRAIRVFDALHETFHHIIDEERAKGAPAIVRIFRLAAQDQGSQDLLGEKMADGAATLYVLEDYSDTRANKGFIRKWDDLRKADYVNFLHDTASSVEAAEEFSDMHPRMKMRLLAVAIQMAEIVYDRGLEKRDLNRTYAEVAMVDNLGLLAANYSPPYSNRIRRAVEDTRSVLLDDVAGLPAPDKSEVRKQVREIMDARSRSCGIIPR